MGWIPQMIEFSYTRKSDLANANMKEDFKKTMPVYKAKHKRFDVVEVPSMQYLMIDGDAGPASPDFAAAIETLYPLAYTLKFASKLELQRDYVVPPLEALWWAENMLAFTSEFDQSQWLWTAMIMCPSWIEQDLFEQSVEAVKAKKTPPSIDKIRLSELTEGRCLQTLHLGPYSDEGPVLKHMHETLIPEMGAQMVGKHHEIYFNDFRKVAPEKLRTILRQPMAGV